MLSSSEQPLVGEEHCVTNLITAAKETICSCVQIKNSLVLFLYLVSLDLAGQINEITTSPF